MPFKSEQFSPWRRLTGHSLVPSLPEHLPKGDPRPGYGASYYAAFALDPDGHNVEAVVGGVG